MSLSFVLFMLLSYIMALLAMAFYTLLERKMLGYFQLRKGPNKVSLMGLPQPLADAMKLFTKEQTPPLLASLAPFLLAPFMALALALLLWILYPSPTPAHFLPLGALLFLSISSLNVYTTLCAGWTSNSKYALLGALRAIAQTISYEVSMSLLMLTALLALLSFDFTHILHSSSTPLALLMLPLATAWFVSNLAETNRTPFDFAEGESELVSGFNVEYAGGGFALIFMAEYTNILMMSLLTAILFLSTPAFLLPLNLWLMVKALGLAALFVWTRASFPRLRYDRLMHLTWKSLLPLALNAMIIIAAFTLSNY